MSSAAFGPSAHQKFSGGWRQRSDDCAAPALRACAGLSLQASFAKNVVPHSGVDQTQFD